MKLTSITQYRIRGMWTEVSLILTTLEDKVCHSMDGSEMLQ